MLCFWLNGPRFEPGAVIRVERMTASCRLLYAHEIRNGVGSGPAVAQSEDGSNGQLRHVRTVRSPQGAKGKSQYQMLSLLTVGERAASQRPGHHVDHRSDHADIHIGSESINAPL